MLLALAVLPDTLPCTAQQIFLNEVMADNKSVLQDEDGEFPDWAELYNAGNEPLDISDWSVTDERDEPQKWRFPKGTVLPAKGYLLVFLSGKNRMQDTLHTSFRLGAGEEPLLLLNLQGQLADSLLPRCMPPDISYGRVQQNGNERSYLQTPTPGGSNATAVPFGITIVPDTLIFSHTGGFYAEGFRLFVENRQPGNEIFYTLDGSVPDRDDRRYQGVIEIENRAGAENRYADIRTSEEYREPEDREVFKGTILRAVAYSGLCPATPVRTFTFFISPQQSTRYQLPVVSLVTEPDNFFGEEEGIYVPPNYERRGRAWEREVVFSFFDDKGKLLLKQRAGARIHGSFSRRGPQKSLRLYARQSYGDAWLNYPFFEELPFTRYKRLLLRSAGSDRVMGTMLKDAVSHDLARQAGFKATQAARTVVLFINGEYWGVHNIRERQDEFYLQQHFNINPEQVNLLENDLEVSEGNADDYQQLLDFLRENDLTNPEAYRYLNTQMDLQNFIDYYAIEIYFANPDWPANNTAYWQAQRDTAKWRWLFFDCDRCFEKPRYNFFNYVREEPLVQEAGMLFRKLWQNPDFRQRLQNRLRQLLQTTFSPGNVIATIEKYERLYAPSVPEHVQRWKFKPATVELWQYNVNLMKEFALKRPRELERQLREFTGNPFSVYPNPSAGRVRIALSGNLTGRSRLRVFSAGGRLLLEQDFAQPASINGQPLDLSSLSPGLYLLRLQSGQQVFSRKLLIE